MNIFSSYVSPSTTVYFSAQIVSEISALFFGTFPKLKLVIFCQRERARIAREREREREGERERKREGKREREREKEGGGEREGREEDGI